MSGVSNTPSDPQITVSVRIEKHDGAAHEAVNGHASGSVRQIEELIASAKRSALTLAFEGWLKKL